MRGVRDRLSAILIAVVFFGFGMQVRAESSVPLAEFSSGSVGEWQAREFAGETLYRIVDLDGRKVLEASSEGSASSLYLDRHIDLEKTPVLEWSWRIDGILDIADERRKEGDDFAARFYVIAPGGRIFNRPLAICYVWSNQNQPGEEWANPFTSKVKMFPLDSGGEGVGEWRTHRRNVVEDFQNLFGYEATKLLGVAIMTDSDNTKLSSRAWYGDVRAFPLSQ